MNICAIYPGLTTAEINAAVERCGIKEDDSANVYQPPVAPQPGAVSLQPGIVPQPLPLPQMPGYNYIILYWI